MSDQLKSIKLNGLWHSLDTKAMDDFPLIVASLPQGDVMKHFHDFIELVYVRKGSGFNHHGNHDYPLHQGDCFVIPPGTEHGYLGGSDLQVVNILFYPEVLGSYLVSLSGTRGFNRFFVVEPFFRAETEFAYKLHFGISQQSVALKIFGELEAELDLKDSGYKPLCTSLLSQFLVLMCRSFDDSLKKNNGEADFTAKEGAIAKAISYIEQNFSSALSVTEVAGNVFMSESHLSHVFKKATGSSLMDYVTKIRVDRAMQLLSTSDQSVSEIAYAVGFHDPSHFGQTFKKIIGHTPSAYRKKRSLKI